MPLVKQGKYKEYYDRCESVKEEMKKCHNHYFDDDGVYDSNYDVFSDFFYSIDAVYREAQDVKNGLEGLLEFSEQKTKKSVKKCEKRIMEMENVISQCVEDFKSLYDCYNNDFTDLERDTFQNYMISREI